jgi:hypothetical protein
MTQKFDHIDASEPIRTVTKSIKLYSDNPIHDCIDRIIDACKCVDRGGKDLDSHLAELEQAAEDLSLLAQRKYLANSAEKLIELSEKRPN